MPIIGDGDQLYFDYNYENKTPYFDFRIKRNILTGKLSLFECINPFFNADSFDSFSKLSNTDKREYYSFVSRLTTQEQEILKRTHPNDIMKNIVSVQVTDSVSGAGEFQINIKDSLGIWIKLAPFIFRLGSQVTLRIGYKEDFKMNGITTEGNKLRMKGMITNIAPGFPEDGVPEIVVKGARYEKDMMNTSIEHVPMLDKLFSEPPVNAEKKVDLYILIQDAVKYLNSYLCAEPNNMDAIQAGRDTILISDADRFVSPKSLPRIYKGARIYDFFTKLFTGMGYTTFFKSNVLFILKQENLYKMPAILQLSYKKQNMVAGGAMILNASFAMAGVSHGNSGVLYAGFDEDGEPKSYSSFQENNAERVAKDLNMPKGSLLEYGDDGTATKTRRYKDGHEVIAKDDVRPGGDDPYDRLATVQKNNFVGQMGLRKLWFMDADATVIGDPDMIAGLSVDVNIANDSSIDGRWNIIQVTHNISLNGYRCALKLKKYWDLMPINREADTTLSGPLTGYTIATRGTNGGVDVLKKVLKYASQDEAIQYANENLADLQRNVGETLQ